MQFEVIKKNHKKEIIIGVIVLVTIAIVFIVQLSFAKYKKVKNMPIVSGTVNYKIPDFNIIAMYKNDGAGDIQISTMPTSGYTINESKSYCNLNNAKDTGAKLYTNSAGEHVMSGLKKGSKCYVYFDYGAANAGEAILSNITVKTGTPNFATIATTDEGVYKAKDESGKDSYYFRGAVTNNYVKFANMFWRIIRINGDGTIRLIYQRIDTQIGTSAFNKSSNDNMYVGFKYTSNNVHGTGTKSTILTNLESWYTSNLASYASKIDTNAGFCGDRTPSTSSSTINNSGGTGTTHTYYSALFRLVDSPKSPVLTCPTEDFYTVSGASKGNKSLTYPIGLITADEVSMAGGLWGKTNKDYYLYTGRTYWTLSPRYFNITYAEMLAVGLDGQLTNDNANVANGVRPVINLKANTTMTGKGTVGNPYIVQ